MIKPDKFTDPHNCIIYDSFFLMKQFKRKNSYKSKKLQDIFEKKLGKQSAPLFVLCLDFLFLLNIIKYDAEKDLLELKNDIE